MAKPGITDNNKLSTIAEPVAYVTEEQVRRLLPKGTNTKVTEDIMMLVNRMGDDVDLDTKLLHDDFLSYVHLISKNPGVGVVDLVNATKFCTLKRNYPNEKAWSLTFPDKYQRLMDDNARVDNHVSAYNTTKLVRAIDKEMLIPAHLQYAPYFHAAVKKQFELMNGKAGYNAEGEPMTVTPMVMHLAAKELALITKQPEEAKIDIRIGQSDAAIEAQRDMTSALEQLVANQSKAFAAGDDVAKLQRVHITTIDENRND